MLILSRKETETIMIGDDIRVTVERIVGNRVQISIAAPKEVKILRAELKPEEHRDGKPELEK